MFDPEGKTIAPPPHVSNGPPLMTLTSDLADYVGIKLMSKSTPKECSHVKCFRDIIKYYYYEHVFEHVLTHTHTHTCGRARTRRRTHSTHAQDILFL